MISLPENKEDIWSFDNNYVNQFVNEKLDRKEKYLAVIFLG